MIRRPALPVLVCDPHFRKFAGRPRGYVHSVYDKAVNIWDGEDLIAVTAGTCYAAPYTGNTAEGGFLACSLREGEAVEGEYPLIRVGGGLVLDCSRAVVLGGEVWLAGGVRAGSGEVWPRGDVRAESGEVRPRGDVRAGSGEVWAGSGEVRAGSGEVRSGSEGIPAGIRRYREYLRQRGIQKGCADFFRRHCAGEELPCPGSLQGEINRRLLTLMRAAGEPERFAAAARKLVGAGLGLTPSGDDFLCGLLTALGSCERAFPLREMLVKGLKGWSGLAATTAVSRQMLKAYLNGECSPLYRRLSGCFPAGGREMEEIMELVEGIGHSSGIDFSAGVAAGYCLIQAEFEMELG